MSSVQHARSPLKIALMGLGRAAINDHLPVFAANRHLFNVVAACELIKSRRDIVQETFPECKMFRKFNDMLDERDIDLVLIALPPVNRVKYALASLERGFWTVVESPAALTQDESKILRGAAIKAKNRLAVVSRGVFQPDYLLALQVISDPRLGKLQKVFVRREEFVRRNDWQGIRRAGGGACTCQLPDLLMPAFKLMQGQPVQMWSEIKRIIATGDVEDYVHLNVVSRSSVSVDIEYNGAMLPEAASASYKITGSKGVFTVMPGMSEGSLVCIDPGYRFPKARTTVKTPPIDEVREMPPVIRETIKLERAFSTPLGEFWNEIYATVRTAAPLSFSLEEAFEAVRFFNLIYKSSQFGR